MCLRPGAPAGDRAALAVCASASMRAANRDISAVISGIPCTCRAAAIRTGRADLFDLIAASAARRASTKGKAAAERNRVGSALSAAARVRFRANAVAALPSARTHDPHARIDTHSGATRQARLAHRVGARGVNAPPIAAATQPRVAAPAIALRDAKALLTHALAGAIHARTRIHTNTKFTLPTVGAKNACTRLVDAAPARHTLPEGQLSTAQLGSTQRPLSSHVLPVGHGNSPVLQLATHA